MRRPRRGPDAPWRPGDVVSSFDGPVGAYVHIPFCERICPFCPYNKVVGEAGLARRYFDALRREIDGYVGALEGDFTSLYIGGGTPTLYPDDLEELVRRLPVAGERAIEVLPTHGTPAGLARLAGMGITAVSIGAQSFHDGVLTRLRRPHDAAAARAAVENAIPRFTTVDVDLIVDVAWDDALAGSFLADLRTCLELGVGQVSTYPLMRFGYTPFGTARHDRRREHEVLRAAAEIAAAAGYERRSVWTFNRIGAAPYTSITRPRFLGMGAGATSFTGRDFLVNHFGIAPYAAAVEKGRLPVARRFHLGPAAGGAYDAFWQAYAGGIDLRYLRARFGPAVAGAAHAAVAPFAAVGLARRSQGGYRLTARGFDVYHDLERWVTYAFIEPLWAEMLTEHGPIPWVTPDRGRSGPAWAAARVLFERDARRWSGRPAAMQRAPQP